MFRRRETELYCYIAILQYWELWERTKAKGRQWPTLSDIGKHPDMCAFFFSQNKDIIGVVWNIFSRKVWPSFKREVSTRIQLPGYLLGTPDIEPRYLQTGARVIGVLGWREHLPHWSNQNIVPLTSHTRATIKYHIWRMTVAMRLSIHLYSHTSLIPGISSTMRCAIMSKCITIQRYDVIYIVWYMVCTGSRWVHISRPNNVRATPP